MIVTLKLNNKEYELTLHKLDIWNDSAEITQADIITLINKVFTDNPEIKKSIYDA